MQSPQNPSSPTSSGASPHIALDVWPSRRVRIAAAVIAAGLFLALLLSPEPAWGWRLAAALAAILLAWRPTRSVLFGRGPTAIRRIEWDAGGLWHLTDGAGRTYPVELSPASAMAGPWLLLIFRPRGLGRRHALIDAAISDPKAFRALKGRLNC